MVGIKLGTPAIWGNEDVTDTSEFAVRSRVLGPDVYKDISLASFYVFTEGDGA